MTPRTRTAVRVGPAIKRRSVRLSSLVPVDQRYVPGVDDAGVAEEVCVRVGAGAIVDSVASYCQRINDSGH
jgi:hypothetical protein